MRSGAGIYCLVVGVLMIAWWVVDIRGGALARPDRSRPEIALHLAAELVTAGLLVTGGLLLIAAGTTGLALTGLGMLLYTVIASPGYFITRHEWAPATMFAVLAVLTIAAIGGPSWFNAGHGFLNDRLDGSDVCAHSPWAVPSASGSRAVHGL